MGSAQYLDRPTGGNTGRLLLAFGGPVCADRISNCPLDRMYKYIHIHFLLLLFLELFLAKNCFVNRFLF